MAAVVLVFAVSIVMTGCVLIALAIPRIVRRYRERRLWDEIVARHRELDRELEQIWRQVHRS